MFMPLLGGVVGGETGVGVGVGEVLGEVRGSMRRGFAAREIICECPRYQIAEVVPNRFLGIRKMPVT